MLDGAPFDQFPFYMQVTTEIDCNWKNLVNAFNEGYHVAVLHQKTLRSAVVPKENPHLHYLDIKHFGRSEEHTSELQSLMRISYAVFCLKTKKIHTTTKNQQHKKYPNQNK